MAKLILKFKDQVLKEYMISSNQLTIGRQPDNDIVIENAAVSKHHAKIGVKDGRNILIDLKSTNGTFVNKKKIRQLELRDADQIIVGKHTLIYEAESPDPQDSGSLSGFGEATMVLNTKQQRDLLVRQKKIATASSKNESKLLIVKNGRRKEFKLKKDLVVIGKSRNSDIVVEGLFVPQMVATISREDSSYYLNSYGRWTSVKVNGRKIITRVKLNKNDTIEIRKVKIIFQYV